MLKRDNAIAVFVIDIDHFKIFNDTYGHAIGDVVLFEVARALRRISRDSDHVARWGGEEFLIVTYERLPDNLTAYAEKLRKAIASMAIQSENCPERLSVTISVGITVTRPDESFEQAFERADAALYQSKQKGRNCCTFN